jgi:hypothetical protein
MAGELVYRVNGTTATTMKTSTLEAAGLRERQHLQEWVLANPAILGPDVMVVTSEFDQWFSKDGRDPDRLDILGLGQDGRLIVAELKRDLTPDLVTMQAINYASRASRFSPDNLADAYLSFHRNRPDAVATADEALSVLEDHAPTLSPDTLRNPRIVIVAGDFTPKVTSAAVWLSERGIDISLTRVQAYAMDEGHVITVSQVWPVPQAEDFVVSPSRVATAAAAPSMPEIEWTLEDLSILNSPTISETILATMDACSRRPGEHVGSDEIQLVTGRPRKQHRGDFGGFTSTLKSKFGRSNAPYAANYAAGDTYQQYYSVTPEIAEIWRTLRGLTLNSDDHARAHSASSPISANAAADSAD